MPKPASRRRRRRTTPSFAGLAASSDRSSRLGRTLSKKIGTRCEENLLAALHALGLHPERNGPRLVGNPDFRFLDERLVVFCDGDFWHGRRLSERLARLRKGHNANYWTKKITSNVDRDRRVVVGLKRLGWVAVRLWETDINRAPQQAAQKIWKAVLARRRKLEDVVARRSLTLDELGPRRWKQPTASTVSEE